MVPPTKNYKLAPETSHLLLTIEPGYSHTFKERNQHQRNPRRVLVYDLEKVDATLKQGRLSMHLYTKLVFHTGIYWEHAMQL